MKNSSVRELKKGTNTVFLFNSAKSRMNRSETTKGETDPTNTTITILTTVSSMLQKPSYGGLKHRQILRTDQL
ncbi:MAG: hypothetical protein JWM28_2007 [Chitinophagaceae bacterium]|nr:hypothetical protein [Chitinophagaceae bacterium]